MFKSPLLDMRTRRHLRMLRNGPSIKHQRYRKIVRMEELQWYITIAAIMIAPIVVAVSSLATESSLKAFLFIS